MKYPSDFLLRYLDAIKLIHSYQQRRFSVGEFPIFC